ncbi:hypothetical protein [Aquitalea sp. USM4]|uniref:hypothetical protein n=1 Tax=Aquitalea sp. USM4 TaxID=1590041 RepID=UPI00103952D7|nr:hypothetical protein [Aquitalea sp. USM4]QBJ79399.1 hypothetical protein DKK66_15765 [Aquitalea sp. USM4]
MLSTLTIRCKNLSKQAQQVCCIKAGHYMAAGDEYSFYQSRACTSQHDQVAAIPLAAYGIETILTTTQQDELLKFEANHFNLKQMRLNP